MEGSESAKKKSRSEIEREDRAEKDKKEKRAKPDDEAPKKKESSKNRKSHGDEGRKKGTKRERHDEHHEKKEKKEFKKKAASSSAAAAPSNDPVSRFGWPNRVATEEDVGITTFMTSTDGFDGALKQRYSDFIVREITSSGVVVSLTSQAIPQDAPEPVKETEDKQEDVDRALESLHSIVGEELFARIVELQSKNEKAVVEVNVELDKASRTRLHDALKRAFQGQVSSSTKGGKVQIATGGEVVDGDFHKHRPGTQRNARWPASRPETLKFVLLKENVETNKAIGQLAASAHIPEKSFRWSGTKDKRAISSQEVTVFKTTAEKILEASKRVRGIRVGNFSYVPEQLSLGALQGNRFDVIIRFISASDELVRDAMSQLTQYGFINFFGLQRFGTTASSTHLVGLSLLRGDARNALDLIITPIVPDWCANRDVEAALKMLESRNHVERTVLESLKREPTNYHGAFHRLPSNLRSLYIHAYQAYLWNVAASARFAQGPKDKPMVGDVVLLDPSEAKQEGEDVDLSYNARVHVLTEADVSKYKIEDVLLPIPGTEVKFPENFVKEKIFETMERNGVPFSKWPEMAKVHHIKGGYRPALARAGNMSFEILRYDDETLPLIPNDMMLLDGKELVPCPEGKHRALRVTFDLSCGSYATMLFRELLKRDTGREYQAKIQDEWKKNK